MIAATGAGAAAPGGACPPFSGGVVDTLPSSLAAWRLPSSPPPSLARFLDRVDAGVAADGVRVGDGVGSRSSSNESESDGADPAARWPHTPAASRLRPPWPSLRPDRKERGAVDGRTEGCGAKHPGGRTVTPPAGRGRPPPTAPR